MADEPQYELPTSQVDLAKRLDEDYVSPAMIWTSETLPEPDPEDVKGRDMKVEGNETDAYTPDVDPMYQNYASDTEKPFRAEGDDHPEAKVEKELLDKEDEGGGGEEPAPEASATSARATSRTTTKRTSSK